MFYHHRLSLFFLLLLSILYHVCCFAAVVLPTGTEGEEQTKADKVTFSTEQPGARPSAREQAELEDKRRFIRNMTAEGWNSYVQYAWEGEALRPVSKAPYNRWSTKSTSGLSIAASASTLHVMDLHTEFARAKQWLTSQLNWDKVLFLPLPELIFHYAASLLSCYALSGDEDCREKTRRLGIILEPGFSNSTGLLYYDVSKSEIFNSLSHIGFQQPELIYSAQLANDTRMKARLAKIRTYMATNITKTKGLYQNYENVAFGNMSSEWFGLSKYQMEFYRNMINSYRQQRSNRQDVELMEKMFGDAVAAWEANGLVVRTGDGHTWLRAYNNATNVYRNKMSADVCKLGVIMALAADSLRANVAGSNVTGTANATRNARSEQYLQLAVNLTETCHQLEQQTKTKLLANEYDFTPLGHNNNNNSSYNVTVSGDSRSLKGYLSDQLAENYFVLWRLTHQPKYRHYAWQLAQAIHTHARTDAGYSDIGDVNQVPAQKSNQQPPALLSSTLKFLYLTFTDDSVLPLDQWIFNSNGHPLPVCGTNPNYPKHLCENW